MGTTTIINAIAGAPRTGKSVELARRLRLAADTYGPHRVAVIAGTRAEAETIRKLAGLTDNTEGSTLDVMLLRQLGLEGHGSNEYARCHDQECLAFSLMRSASISDRHAILRHFHYGTLWGYLPHEIPVPKNLKPALKIFTLAYLEDKILDYGHLLIKAMDIKNAPVGLDGQPLQSLFIEDIQLFSPIERALLSTWARFIPTTWTRDTWNWRDADAHIPIAPHERCNVPVEERTEMIGDRPNLNEIPLGNEIANIFDSQIPLDYMDVPLSGDSITTLNPPDPSKAVNYLIDQLCESHDKGRCWNDNAIVVRHLHSCGELFKALRFARIPWRIHGRDFPFSWPEPDGYGPYINTDVRYVHMHSNDLPISVSDDDLPSYVPDGDGITVVPVRSTRNRTWPVVHLPLGSMGGWPLLVPETLRPETPATDYPAGMEIGLHCSRERALFLHALTRHREHLVLLPEGRMSPFLQLLTARLSKNEKQRLNEGNS